MKKTQRKDALRNIGKQSVSFASIIVIALLGVAAFLGIRYAAEAMRINGSAAYNSQHFRDLEVVSTLLLTEDDVESVGVGIPGIASRETGEVIKCTNMGWHHVPFRAEFVKHLDVPVFIDNDANCAALAELVCGENKGFNNIIVMTVGTGIGGGIIINKKIYHGKSGRGGEIGHICINSKGRKCPCGGRGCFEHYASATALIKETEKAVLKNPDSALARYAKKGISGKTVFDAAYDGNCPVARKVLDKYITCLNTGIYSIYNIFEPDAIILAGGISKAGDRLLLPLREKAGAHVPIFISSLQGDAGMIGAALLNKYND